MNCPRCKIFFQYEYQMAKHVCPAKTIGDDVLERALPEHKTMGHVIEDFAERRATEIKLRELKDAANKAMRSMREEMFADFPEYGPIALDMGRFVFKKLFWRFYWRSK